MDIPQKIALFNEVATNQKHPSELKDILDDEHNFIHFAVEHIVNERLAQASGSQRSFRFKVVETAPTDELEEVEVEGQKVQRRKLHETLTLTPWLPEVSQFSAPVEMGRVRQQHPRGKISIERR